MTLGLVGRSVPRCSWTQFVAIVLKLSPSERFSKRLTEVSVPFPPSMQ